jgi:uncharacterized protein with HEPN domain
MKEDRLYITNILECIERIKSYIAEGRDSFLKSRMIQDAVIRNFEVMGEATKRLSQELRSNNSDIPWRQMAGFRDMLIHDYSKIDVGEVWGLNHRFGHSGRMACLISKVSSMRDRALRHLVQMNYSVNGQS